MSTTGTTLSAVIEQALRAATRAPSVHNTQPWRFVVAGSSVEVHLDQAGGRRHHPPRREQGVVMTASHVVRWAAREAPRRCAWCTSATWRQSATPARSCPVAMARAAQT